MEQRSFGSTAMRVSVLGFGGSEIGPITDQAQVDRLLLGALDAGLNVIDTAACYGQSEERIGRAIAGRRHEVYLFTKCGHAAGLDTPDWDPETLARSIDRSLSRLRTDYVDLIQLHSASLERLQQGDLIAPLVRAKEAGKVRYLGYSGDNAAARFAVKSGFFDSLQTSINVADQGALTELVPLAAERKMGVIAKRPVANVAWQYAAAPDDRYLLPYWERLQSLRYPFTTRALSDAVGVALRFTLSVPGVSTAIVGTRTPGRFEQNARLAALGPLAPAEFQAIRDRWLGMAGSGLEQKT